MNRVVESALGVPLEVWSACRACEQTFRAASRLVADRRLQARLARHADGWKEALTLLTEASERGVEDSLESTRATLRRAWIQLKAAADEHQSIVAECARSAAAARTALRAARMQEQRPNQQRVLGRVLELTAALGDPADLKGNPRN